MKNEKSIKSILLYTLPKYGIKINYSSFTICTFNEVKFTCINEELISIRIDIKESYLIYLEWNYNKKYILTYIVQKEIFDNFNFLDYFFIS